MTSQQPPSRLPEQPSEPKALDFDYAALDAETRIVVQQRTSEIKTLMRRAASDIFDIGQKLVEVKAKLGHGHFRSWLKAEFKWSVSTATRFMQVAEQFKYANLMHLPIAASALYELAAPSTPIDARLEAIERASFGEVISYSKAKEIADHYQSATEITADQSVTIDVDALTLETESSATVKQHQLPPSGEELEPQLTPPSKASRFIQSTATDQTKATPVSAPVESREHLLDVKPNHPSPSADEHPFTNSQTAKSTALNPRDICTLLVTNVEYLTNEEIKIVWQALAHRLTSVTLCLPNFSNSQLQHLIENAQRELSARHSSQFNGQKEDLEQ